MSRKVAATFATFHREKPHVASVCILIHCTIASGVYIHENQRAFSNTRFVATLLFVCL